MNLVSFPIYNYINIALSALFILVTFIFKIESSQIFVNLIPVIIIGFGIYAISIKSGLNDNIKKNVVLGGFIGSIIVSFAPYILQYSTNKQLLFSSLAFTILLLINIFLVKLVNKEEK